MSDQKNNQPEKYLSEFRLYRFKSKVKTSPLEMYFDNLNLSERLMSMIAIFEVIFRNRIDSVLTEKFGDNYLSNPKITIFNKHEKEKIKSAYRKAKSQPIRNKKSRALTELTLGFWCNLVKKSRLWTSCVHNIHPQRKGIKFKTFKKNIGLIYEIRNKIAHHERILRKRPYNVPQLTSIIIYETRNLVDNTDKQFLDDINQFLESKTSEIIEIIKKQK